jgi:agarase
LVLVVVLSTVGMAVGAGQAAAAPRAQAKTVKAPKSMFPATGYFSLGQSKGRWWLVTPQGQPFYAAGIDTVAPDGSGTDQVTGICPYCQTVANDYPSTSAWGTATIARLRSWGFNTMGAFSDSSDLGSQMPYEVQLTMASGDDWFSPSFVTGVDNVAATQVAPLANDPNLIGYFTDSELNWGIPVGSVDPLNEYLALPPGSPGLAVAQQYVGNPQGFIYALATRYFQVTSAALHEYDPHHLNLGIKAEGSEISPALLEAAQPYVDVFSMEDYALQPGLAQVVTKSWPQYLPVDSNLADFEQYVKRPLMIGEYAFITPSPATPSTMPGVYLTSPTQQARAQDFENFISPLYLDSPWLVGDDWFQYVDEPQNGRPGDGENDNFGMVNVDDQPYPTMTAAMQFMHSQTAQNRLDPTGTSCDSWASGPGGVTCTATVPAIPPYTSYPLTIVTRTMYQSSEYSPLTTGQVVAAGGDVGTSFKHPSYKFSLSQGTLPKGIKLQSSGELTGTARSAGTFSITVTVTDGAGAQVSQAYSLVVVPPGT